jgi:hypothetical protein
VTFSDFLRTKALAAGDGSLRVFGSHPKPYRFPWLLLPLLLSSPAIAQKATPGIDAVHATKAAEPPIKFESIPYISSNRRDPFLNPKHYRKTAAPKDKDKDKDKDEEIPRGIPPPGIAGAIIAQAALEGISISKDRRIAIIHGPDSRSYFLKEGDRLFDGYLKSILDDSIIFVRETKMRSGKILTQDITKRLRTP